MHASPSNSTVSDEDWVNMFYMLQADPSQIDIRIVLKTNIRNSKSYYRFIFTDTRCMPAQTFTSDGVASLLTLYGRVMASESQPMTNALFQTILTQARLELPSGDLVALDFLEPETLDKNTGLPSADAYEPMMRPRSKGLPVGPAARISMLKEFWITTPPPYIQVGERLYEPTMVRRVIKEQLMRLFEKHMGYKRT